MHVAFLTRIFMSFRFRAIERQIATKVWPVKLWQLKSVNIEKRKLCLMPIALIFLGVTLQDERRGPRGEIVVTRLPKLPKFVRRALRPQLRKLYQLQSRTPRVYCRMRSSPTSKAKLCSWKTQSWCWTRCFRLHALRNTKLLLRFEWNLFDSKISLKITKWQFYCENFDEIYFSDWSAK